MHNIFRVVLFLYGTLISAEEINIIDFGEPIEILIKGNGEYCMVSISNYSNISKTDCIKITNSKNTKILCTKTKKLCKTEEEVISYISQVEGSAKADSYYEDEEESITQKEEITEKQNSPVQNSLSLCMLQCDTSKKCSLATYPIIFRDINHDDIKRKNNNIISTLSDIRGTKAIDIILLKANFRNRKSCYIVSSLYSYKEDRYYTRSLSVTNSLITMFRNKFIATPIKTEKIKFNDIMN